MHVVLYSTGCPKCNVLKKKLAHSNITFEEVTDVDIMTAKGFVEVPKLEVDGVVMGFAEANQWINKLGGTE